MKEIIKIFLLFLGCWSVIQAIYFIILSLADFKKTVTNIQEFFVFVNSLLVGILIIPFSKLYSDWWFFAISTALYFLFGGGILVFVVIFVLGLLLSFVPSFLGLMVLKNYTSENKKEDSADTI